MHNQIEEGAEDARTCNLELPPQLPFRLPPCVGNWRQGQEDRAVREVRPCDDFLDAIAVTGRTAVRVTARDQWGKTVTDDFNITMS
jgi:hypothetical protein